MTTKFIYHYKTLDVVDDIQINSTPASEKPIVIIGSVDGKHTQVNIQPFNAEHQLEASLSFATRLQYYAKTLRTMGTI